MLELFKNAAKIRQLYNDGEYIKAAALLLKTLAAIASEFDQDEAGVLTVRAKRTTKADQKQLEKAEATLEGMRQEVEGQQRTAAGGIWVGLIIQLLPVLIDLIRKRRGEAGQPA